MTLQQYQETPQTARPQELIFGRMRVADAPFVPHQRIVFAVARAWQRAAAADSLGEVLIAPTDVILDAERGLVVQPDALFVSRDRAAMVHERVYGAPDLVLEVLSPRPRLGDVDERIRWFASYGVSEIWVYHQPVERLEVLTCADRRVVGRTWFDERTPVRSRVLRGFTETMADVTAR